MILLGLSILVVISVLVIGAGRGMAATDRAERRYVALSPLPWVLGVIVPATVGLSGLVPEAWSRRSTWIGLIVSAIFAVVGVVLIVRMAARRSRWSGPLVASVVLASAPLLLVLVSTGLLWVMGRVR